MRRPRGLVLLLALVSLVDPRLALGCSCSRFVGLLETAREAPHVIEARVLSHEAAPEGTSSESIVVEVLRSFKGDLAGQVRLYGSGRGDCTVQATRFVVGDTLLFVLTRPFPQPLEGKPGYGLYGVCHAVSAWVRDGQVQGVLQSTQRGQERQTAAVSLGAFLRAIGVPAGH